MSRSNMKRAFMDGPTSNQRKSRSRIAGRPVVLVMSAVAGIAGIHQSAQAAEYFWNNSGSGNWDGSLPDTTRFGAPQNTIWQANDFSNIADFNSAGSTATVGAVSANGITFNETATISSGTITLGATTPTITTNANATIGSVLAGTAGLTFAGSGTLTLSNAQLNTYTGNTTINAGGTLTEINSVNAAWTLNSPSTTISSGWTLTLDFSHEAGSQQNQINAVAVGGTLNLKTIAGLTAVIGTGDSSKLTGDGLINVTNGGTLRANNSLDISTFTGTFSISGNSTLNLNGATFATGNKATLDIASGSTFSLAGNAANIDGLNGAGSVTANSGVKLSVGNNGGDGAFSGVIQNVALTKNGRGTQTLSGANTYSGATTINDGNLELTNASGSATGTGAVALSVGALSGTGSASGAVTVTNGSQLAPGTATANNFGTIGTLTLGSTGGLTLTNASLDYDLGTTNSSALNDLISTSALTLTSLDFTFNGTTLTPNTLYQLIGYSGTETGGVGAISGTTFTGGLASGGYTPTYSLQGNSLDVSFTAAPEPGSATLLGPASLMFLNRRRRGSAAV